MAYVSVNYENERYMPEPLRRFATEAFAQAGLPPEDAAELAGYLVATDLRGVLSHGTHNVPHDVDIQDRAEDDSLGRCEAEQVVGVEVLKAVPRRGEGDLAAVR